ncbi:MAG: hypothetical protein IJT79_06855 [Ruminococcus sp.]|nr:hypothetical protein [Ruminococcus sp.]
MKSKYYEPIITIETLQKQDVLCASENAYVDYDSLGKSDDFLTQVLNGTLWND